MALCMLSWQEIQTNSCAGYWEEAQYHAHRFVYTVWCDMLMSIQGLFQLLPVVPLCWRQTIQCWPLVSDENNWSAAECFISRWQYVDHYIVENWRIELPQEIIYVVTCVNWPFISLLPYHLLTAVCQLIPWNY